MGSILDSHPTRTWYNFWTQKSWRKKCKPASILLRPCNKLSINICSKEPLLKATFGTRKSSRTRCKWANGYLYKTKLSRNSKHLGLDHTRSWRSTHLARMRYKLLTDKFWKLWFVETAWKTQRHCWMMSKSTDLTLYLKQSWEKHWVSSQNCHRLRICLIWRMWKICPHTTSLPPSQKLSGSALIV